MEAISDGTYVMLKGLPLGHHTLHASGFLADFTRSSTLNFVLEVMYDLNIIPLQ